MVAVPGGGACARAGLRGLIALGPLLALAVFSAARADNAKLPAGITCDIVRANVGLIPADWPETAIERFVTRQLGFSLDQYRAAKRCMARDGRFTGSGNREK